MNKITIELAPQEAETLVQLLDIAVKSGGLSVAEAALFFLNKLKETQKEGAAIGHP
jgi:hypothetical protein